jgi:S-DNA-T family DNA segregation ATPase FtsK/SpoIIIE
MLAESDVEQEKEELPSDLKSQQTDVAFEDNLVDVSVKYPEEEKAQENPDSQPQKQPKKQSGEGEIGMEVTQTAAEEEVQRSVQTHKSGKYDPRLDLENYQFPTFDMLPRFEKGTAADRVSADELEANKAKIVDTLANYNIKIDKIKATIGPTVTLYEIIPAPGVRISKIKNLEDDIALSLAALGIRIIAPMPGKGTVGIEVPNQNPEMVSMRAVIASKKFQESGMELPMALGKTITNETYVIDLTKLPHLLVAGATGQGKSVGLNVILTSLLYQKHPAELKLVLIDPKKVELSLYNKLSKHYLAQIPDAEEPIITDTNKVITTLNSLCLEMDNRYDLLKSAHTRNLKEYNKKFIDRRLNPEKGHRFLPYIVVIIDEFADLIMTAGKEIEMPIARLAQLARAIGIHLIIATQRPTTNIITGVIKANFPARIAFRVTSGIDSKTILDGSGANQLIGRGDMLISTGAEPVRLQCAFVDTPELEVIMDHIAGQQSYTQPYELPEYAEEGSGSASMADLEKRDVLFDDAARLIVAHQQGSTSLIQRKFSIGYNRAGRIVDQLEAAAIVGHFEGSKARQVLIPDEYALEQHLNKL